MNDSSNNIHSAAPVALAFYFQSLYALTLLLKLSDDEGAVSVETLDDVSLKTEGQDFLSQLKHSVTDKPPSISIKSDAFWKTIKAWIDVFGHITLSDTHFCLVSVGELASESPLFAFTTPESDRTNVLLEMEVEAKRVCDMRTEAQINGDTMPYSARFKGCVAFLDLSDPMRKVFISRITLKPAEGDISTLEEAVSDGLKSVLQPKYRKNVAAKVVAWWDREVLYSLCKQRSQYITKLELQLFIGQAISILFKENVIPEFETVDPPENHIPHSVMVKQIGLVNGTSNDRAIARREEWRARSQRSKWTDDRLDMASKIDLYDKVLIENWSDKHSAMCEECATLDDNAKTAKGLALLRWSHNDAPHTIRPFTADWNAQYLVRGSFQILSIDKKVGWHPNYIELLDIEE